MKLFTAFVMAACCISLTCKAQTIFQKTYGPSETKIASPHMAQQTSDGGLIIAGRMDGLGAGMIDFYLARINASGILQWAKTYGSVANDRVFSVLQTSDGGFAAAGWTNSFSGPDSAYFIYLVRTDSNGNLLWSKKIGDIDWYHVIDFRQTTDGGFILCGYLGIATADYVYLVKTDAAGNISWTKTLMGNSEIGWSIQQTTDGGFIIAGVIIAADGNIYMVKTDNSGNILWTRSIGGAGWEEAYSVCQSLDGGYVVAGYTDEFGAGSSDVYLIKTDSTGNLLWSKTYGGSGDEYGYAVQQSSDGGFIISGSTNSFGSGDDDMYLVKTDSAGNLTWSRTFGTSVDNEESYSVQETADGGFILTGQTGSLNSWSAYVVKTDVNGYSGCNENTPATIADTAASVITTPSTPPILPYGIASTVTTNVGNGGNETIVCILTGSDEKSPEENSVTLSPNPAASELIIKCPEFGSQTWIEIYDLMGQRVFSQWPATNSQLFINVSSLRPGIYFVHLTNRDGIQTQKLVIQR